jgi:hypothetical protein
MHGATNVEVSLCVQALAVLVVFSRNFTGFSKWTFFFFPRGFPSTASSKILFPNQLMNMPLSPVTTCIIVSDCGNLWICMTKRVMSQRSDFLIEFISSFFTFCGYFFKLL